MRLSSGYRLCAGLALATLAWSAPAQEPSTARSPQTWEEQLRQLRAQGRAMPTNEHDFAGIARFYAAPYAFIGAYPLAWAPLLRRAVQDTGVRVEVREEQYPDLPGYCTVYRYGGQLSDLTPFWARVEALRQQEPRTSGHMDEGRKENGKD